MAREYFNAYHSYLKSIEPLNDAERGRLFTALLEYSSTGAEPDLRGNERFIFPMMRQQIDRDEEKYQSRCDQNRQNILQRYTNEYDRIQTPTKSTKAKDKAKEKTKAKDKANTGDLCAEQNSSAPPVCTMPLNTGEEYPITGDQVAEWSGLYPAVDVMQALRNMRGWCLANPKNRKTQAGMLRFITSWLAREQDKGGSKPVQQKTGGSMAKYARALQGEKT